MRLTRIQKVQQALGEGASISFEYMKLGGGRKSIERRLVDPLRVDTAHDGRVVLNAEDRGRDGKPRSFRIERMFHVELA